MATDETGEGISSVGETTEAAWVTKMAVRYERFFPLRAAVQAVPMLGGPLDAFFGGLGAQWRARRLKEFLAILSQRLDRIATFRDLPSVEASEPLYDFVRQVLEQVARTRSAEKRRRFANVVANQVQRPESWDDADAATSLLAELTDLDVLILATVISAVPCGEPFTALRVATLHEKSQFEQPGAPGPLMLRRVFPTHPTHALSLSVSRLLFRGLLEDEGVGRMGIGALEYFVPSDLGVWFLDWVSEREEGRGTV